MSSLMHYKGYDASVAFSEEDGVFFGKVEGIKSLISFEGTTVAELREGFHEAVEDYLSMCKSKGIEAEKPFKGSLNIRLGSELHRKLYLLARVEDVTINHLIKDRLQAVFAEKKTGLKRRSLVKKK